VPREPGFNNPQIIFPKRVDTRLIHGVANAHRFLPAQTLRHMDFARWGRLEDDLKATMEIDGIDEAAAFRVRRDLLVSTVANASDHVKLSGDLGAKIAEQLLKNGLTPEQVSSILDKSYSIKGLQEEHGKVPEFLAVRQALARALGQNPATGRVTIDA
jgi:hypothetical protein